LAEQTQCDQCGAVLLKEDLFCGECGAPRPAAAVSGGPAEKEQPGGLLPPVPAPPPSAAPTASARARWRSAFIVLVVLAAIACVAGIVAFFVFGSMPGEATTPEQDWLFSAMCCLLPIGGTGAILGAIGGFIWYTRLRER
jgi:hypothetical protein